MKNEIIFFDCMETLIDMTEIPDSRLYALWAYNGSGVEKYWQSAEEFVADFLLVRKFLQRKPPYHKEYDIQERLKIVVEKKLGSDNTELNLQIVDKLISSFWNKYVKRCYIAPEVNAALKYLYKKGYSMSIISNFLVKGGVQELLDILNISRYFRFVLTSVEEGWRKPHSYMYKKGLELAGCEAEDAVFIGDDYKNDYLTPKNLGFRVIFYDKKGIYPHLKRIKSFKEIKNYF